jgi:hypothetical protein
VHEHASVPTYAVEAAPVPAAALPPTVAAARGPDTVTPVEEKMVAPVAEPVQVPDWVPPIWHNDMGALRDRAENLWHAIRGSDGIRLRRDGEARLSEFAETLDVILAVLSDLYDVPNWETQSI